MRCPYCQHKDTQVIDSRAPDEGAVIRRRRRCLSCGKRFTTFERAQLLCLSSSSVVAFARNITARRCSHR